MGLLKQFEPTFDDLPEPEPEIRATIVETKPKDRVVAAPVEKPKKLDIKRDAHGTIESVTGVDRDGRRVKFEFERDGRRQLERIKVR